MQLKDTEKVAVYKRKKPLCFYDNHLLLSDNNKLYSLNLYSYEIDYLSSINIDCLHKLLGKNRYLYRLLRLGIHYAVYAKGKVYIVYGKKLYSLNVSNNTIVTELTFNRGKGPLTITVVDNPFGNFESGVYFGEYFNNPNKDQVNVYFKSIKGSNWINLFTFPKGTINHIHAIVPDLFRNIMWILTGDFDNSAGMWIADMNFKNVVPLVRGKQIYRSCVAFPTKEGLIYATDSQLEKNYICFLHKKKENWESKILHEINGSCIYGCKVGEKFIFSTSTEPGIDKKSH